MRVLLGGSFDPVHEGHLQSAVELHHLLRSTVWLLPAARSPLKAETTADQHRLAMLQCAIAGHSGLAVDARELQRPPPSYTIDTLTALRHELGVAEPLVWTMGADALARLDQWKNWRSLPDLAHLLIIDRPDCHWPRQGAVADWLATLPQAAALDQLQCAPAGLLARVSLTPQPFSSTALRAQLAAGGPRPDGLPEAVWHYLREHRLYTHTTPARDGQEAP